MLNGYEIILIFGIALLVFGAKKLPELARGLGQGIREFKKASREVSDHLESAIESEATAPSQRPPSESGGSTTSAPHQS